MKNGRIPQTWSHGNRYEGMTNTIVQLRIPFCSGSMVEASCAIISDRSVGQRIVAAHPPIERLQMDWNRLVQLAMGSRGLEQWAILLVRVSLGLFFAVSGGNKLFVAGGTKPVYETLVKAKVPFPRQTAYFVSSVEFVCGSLLIVGFLSSPASLALLIDMTVATLTNSLSTLPEGVSPLSWLDDFLYLPEVLYVLFFAWLLCSGPGKFSVDHWLAGELMK